MPQLESAGRLCAFHNFHTASSSSSWPQRTPTQRSIPKPCGIGDRILRFIPRAWPPFHDSDVLPWHSSRLISPLWLLGHMERTSEGAHARTHTHTHARTTHTRPQTKALTLPAAIGIYQPQKRALDARDARAARHIIQCTGRSMRSSWVKRSQGQAAGVPRSSSFQCLLRSSKRWHQRAILRTRPPVSQTLHKDSPPPGIELTSSRTLIYQTQGGRTQGRAP